MTTVYMKTHQIDQDAEPVRQHVSNSPLELVLQRVRLRARRRATWLTHLRSNADEGTLIASDANLAACLVDRDRPEAEAAWYERARIVYQSASVEQAEQAKRELGLTWITSQIENCATEESADAPPCFDRRSAQS